MRHIKPIMPLCFLLGLYVSAQAQSEVCSLRTSWVRKEPFASSSWSRVGTFPFTNGDEQVTKSFHDEESGVNVSVGVKVTKSMFEKQPDIIGLAIAFSDKPEDVFEEVGNAEAEAVYDKHWRMLSVSRSITAGERIYTFNFGCERRRKAR